jgi:sec-independent protein translocase protein TatC
VVDLDAIDKARKAVTDRAELPGMSLMEHLTELRKRLIHSVYYLIGGFIVAYAFHVRLYNYVQRPVTDLGLRLNFTHPTDGLNLYLKTSFVGGAILASPFILYQIWLFISPGMYANEKKYVWPFMSATITLFLTGAWFGYRWVLPGAIKVLVLDFGKAFNPILTIEDYTGFFLAVILGLGITFELPILVLFLSLFGIVSPKFLWKNIRYAILIIFVIAAIITPTPDPLTMFVFAAPLLILYLLSIGISFMVHPSRRKKLQEN